MTRTNMSTAGALVEFAIIRHLVPDSKLLGRGFSYMSLCTKLCLGSELTGSPTAAVKIKRSVR